jgi:hypothetical protein
MSEPEKITREELYERIWKMPATKLAKELGISDVALAKVCRTLNVPKPGPGHWRLIQLGWEIARPALPALEERAAAEAKIEPESQPAGKLGETPAAPALPPATEGVLGPSEAAERGVLDLIRQATRIDFWRECISIEVYPGGLAGWLEVEAGEKALERAVKNVRKEYRAFRVEVKDAEDRYGQQYLQVRIVLREGCEWKDAWEEAWTFAEKPNAHCLSDNALRLYLWARGPKNTGRMTDVRRIGAQARLRRTYSDVEDHLREIQFKADSTIQWEDGHDEAWHDQMRVWFQGQDAIFYHHGPLNPALGLNLRTIEFAELERFKSWLHAEVLKPGFPDGRETVGIFDVRDRKTLKTAFGKLPDSCGKFAPDPDFFEALRVVEGVVIAHEFANGVGPWIVTCQPEEGVTWREIKERLGAKAKEMPLEKRYKLSGDSRALLKWILGLRSDEYLLGMTPPVEAHLERDIGLGTEVEEENVRGCVELLVEEINEQTEFNLRTIGWHHYTKEQTRILVRKKRADLEEIVRAVQVWGLGRDKLLDGDCVRASLERLVGET